MGELNENMCLICRVDFSTESICDKVKLSDKGIETLRQYSLLRGDKRITEYLLTLDQLEQQKDVNVHSHCRKDYTNKRSYEQMKRKVEQHAEETVECKVLRSTVDTFNWKEHCFLCKKNSSWRQ